MDWMAIDSVEVRNVGRRLAAHAASGDDVRATMVRLATKAELDVAGLHLLDDLADRLRDMARSLLQAATTVDEHVLHVAPHPALPLTAAGQLASHNTYQSDLSVRDLHEAGVRAFEFDLHGPSRSGEWAVYHHALDRDSNVGSLSDALANVASLPADSVTTVFLDLKDAPAPRFDQQMFDRAIRDAFGDRLFTPLDLIVRSPGAVTVGEAATTSGWPTFAELSTNVLVVVTGDVASYRALGGLTAAAFVSARPTRAAIADPHIVVYNAPAQDLTPVQVLALQQTGGLVRTWGHPTEAGRHANYLALDL